MSENQTGHPLIKYFQKCSQEFDKIYLSSDDDIDIANGIDSYFANGRGIEFGRKCIEFYFKHHKGLSVGLKDFVRQLTDIAFAVQTLEEDERDIKNIMRRTKEIMEGLG